MGCAVDLPLFNLHDRVEMGTLFSFLFFTALVGLVTYFRTRKENLSSSKGYFLGGKTLNGWVIAGSLLLTNLSAANFTGMTGMVYGGNLAPVAWTVTVIPPLIFFLRGDPADLPAQRIRDYAGVARASLRSEHAPAGGAVVSVFVCPERHAGGALRRRRRVHSPFQRGGCAGPE
jgi:hypothetical protein